MARDAVASATRDAGDIRCEVGIAPVFSWSPSLAEGAAASVLAAAYGLWDHPLPGWYVDADSLPQ
jgi:hypothetical protein